jgi:hypothetical protein
MGLYQTKKYCIAKETVNRVKRQFAEWKKFFASYSPEGGLISSMYKELKKTLTTAKE